MNQQNKDLRPVWVMGTRMINKQKTQRAVPTEVRVWFGKFPRKSYFYDLVIQMPSAAELF